MATRTQRQKHQAGTLGLPLSASICVVGAGRSGCAAARLALDAGYTTTVVDQRPRKALQYIDDTIDTIDTHATLVQQRAQLCIRQRATEQQATELELTEIAGIDIIVISPGVPASVIDNPDSLPIWSEVEFAYRFVEGRAHIIGVTGSNGKSTTTRLIDHLLTKMGEETTQLSHWTAGNIGKPLSEYLVEATTIPDWIVLELSSYQLEHIDRFRANIAILLNLSPDHLARYPGGLDDYYFAKRRLFESQLKEDIVICYAQSECTRILAGQRTNAQESLRPPLPALAGHVQYFGYEKGATIDLDAIVSADEILIKANNATHHTTRRKVRPNATINRKNISVVGDQNALNIAAASLAVLHTLNMSLEENAMSTIASSTLPSAVYSFLGLPHRMAHVATINEVDYINDSKATNVGAVIASLSEFQKPVILLLGGYDKGLPFTDLAPVIASVCRQVICFGQAGPEIARQLSSADNKARIFPNLEHAISAAATLARPGDAVVLSPACSSFDEFKNFEARGDAFERIVKSMGTDVHNFSDQRTQ